MSIFLIYFEENNPSADWRSFKETHESVFETFENMSELKNMWRIAPADIRVDDKVISAFLIHDGISSDKVLQANMREPIIAKQRNGLIHFFSKRLQINSINCYFVFHLYKGGALTIEPIEYIRFQELKLTDVSNFAGVVEREVLYKLGV